MPKDQDGAECLGREELPGKCLTGMVPAGPVRSGVSGHDSSSLGVIPELHLRGACPAMTSQDQFQGVGPGVVHGELG